ncbi:transcription-repair coupling factor [Roseobacter sp. HKCCA0434]|uniref:transcription-repair coupling factor n=1 Tax=Roseobacter sp. HKCCA0434 TaxID=3079297 RepID=UPI002905C2A3|nr:transcription-repair coupling factor [Roseobacter sp. HKCCA0434]
MKDRGPLQSGTVLVGGAPEGHDARLIAEYVQREGGPLLHVARDDVRLAAMRTSLAFVAPELPVLEFPAWDCLPYDRISPAAEISATRMATLATLADGFDRPAVVLTTLNAAMQRVPARAQVAGASFTATAGSRIDEGALRGWLARMGFAQTSTVTEPGDYAIRGGLIDIYPPGPSGPIRLDLFGDVLDSVRRFRADTQRTTEEIARIELAPVSEVVLDEPAIERFRRGYREMFGQPGPEDALYESVSAGRKHQGYEHWAPLFQERMERLFDYLPDAPVTLDDQVEPAREARWETIEDHYRARREVLDEKKGRRDGAYKPLPPKALYLDEGAWADALDARAVRKFSPNPTPSGPGVTDAGARTGRNFAPERQAEDLSLFGALARHISDRRKAGAVVVASYSKGARERMATLLADSDVRDAKMIERLSDAGGKGSLNLAIWGLESGFEAPDLTVIAEQDVLGDRLVRRGRRKKRADNFLTEATSLAPGDLVVHVEHGVGRYHGLETITAAGAPHECLALEYADNARLYLPVENIELLTRYGHEEGLLDRLGGGAWQAKKAKLKERIKLAAERLIKVAAERELRRAPVLTPPEGLWDEFCARFPYQETDDQLSAIADVLDDMGAGKPMDRLICGDVGFGKTEVALRAAFVAAMSGVQVAVIAPTTLLARQHYKAFAERFRGLPVKVRQMSRFVSTTEMAKTREGLARNEIEIVVGTHAVLAKQVKFANLGLLIIDEEQHFGVQHKERLKELRSDIHVLTMTATPIPRTLQLSLSGVRELSIIGTPPVDRLAIRTYVSEFDPLTVREALLREKYRGGQAFYVVPRVTDLAEIEAFLREEVPEVSFVTAHGQLAAGDLDDRMNAFYDGQYDVLLATTIVESGIDIPAANTLIVHRADMFGLAQLYQIRGRVGRSKIRAYAYLTTKRRKKLTPAAQKRLRVLGSLDSLGAGFALASQDLDIRGAGNLLGEEQSGQIKEVGYALYQDMLEEAIAKLKSGQGEGLSDDGQWSPQINLGVPVLIPEAYVPDLDVRLGLYRRLSTLDRKVELEGFAAELIDRFGDLPPEVDTLLKVVRIKAMCRKANIGRIDGGPKGATVQFHENRFASPQGLVQFIQDQNGRAKIKDNKVVVQRNWPDEAARINGAYTIARDLARLAKS